MSSRRTASAGIAVVAGLACLAVPAVAFADTQLTCAAGDTSCAVNAYSGGGEQVTPGPSISPSSEVASPSSSPTTQVEGVKFTASGGDQGATLPFTGGEISLMTVVGLTALGGGTALVVSGRRRKSPRHRA